jgi:hypothetical protein
MPFRTSRRGHSDLGVLIRLVLTLLGIHVIRACAPNASYIVAS